MSITHYVHTRYVGDHGETKASWRCDTLICSDLKDALRGMWSRPSDTTIIGLAARCVELVSHFEDEPGYIDFALLVGGSNAVTIPIRIGLDLSPAPLVVLSLIPSGEGRVADRKVDAEIEKNRSRDRRVCGSRLIHSV